VGDSAQAVRTMRKMRKMREGRGIGTRNQRIEIEHRGGGASRQYA